MCINMKFMAVLDSWIFHHYLYLLDLYLYLLPRFPTAWKKLLGETILFFLKNSNFYAVTFFWRICLKSRMIYNFRILDSQSRIKFTSSTSVKFSIRNFIPGRWGAQTDKKRQHLVYPQYSKGSRYNNIRPSSPSTCCQCLFLTFQ